MTFFSRAQWKRKQLLQVISILYPETALDLNWPLTSVNTGRTLRIVLAVGGNPAEQSFLPPKSLTLSITPQKVDLIKEL